MPSGGGARSPRHLLALFLGTTFVLLATLGWLGWQSLQQDRRVESQLVRDRLESATDLVAAQIRQNLTDTQEQLSHLAAAPIETAQSAASEYAKQLGDDALIAVFDAQRVNAYPAGRLLYYPGLPERPDPPAAVFALGQTLEYKDLDFRGASTFFERLTRSTDDAVRAGALLGLARNQRKAGQSQAALDTYGRLAAVTGASLGGWPADLRARTARCALLEQLGRREQLAAEAEKLDADLHTGRWPLTRSRFIFLTGEVRGWLGRAPPATAPTGGSGGPANGRRSVALALAATVDALWERWQRDPAALNTSNCQSRVIAQQQSVSLLCRGTPTRLVALVSGPGFLEHHLVTPLRELLERHNVGIVLSDVEGRTLLSYGTPAAHDTYVDRMTADTQLPWTLRVVSADPEADFTRLAARRWLLIGGLGFMALLAVAGSYFSLRGMTREIEAARLQSEFVAAVSHEFRTPLTSLRQFSDLLADGRVPNEADRQKFYAALQRGTRRLTRLVENLLDFGRMEAGFYRFVLDPVCARDLVERVVSEFADEVRQRGYDVELQWTAPNEPLINADEAALGRALWNLLDNAVKYSPDCKTVWVDGAVADRAVTISVRDRGIGVAAPEQRAIFQKFVRGSLPSGYTIKGTGLGLALVDQIVQAHGGKVTVQSASGQGSTFTIVLPVQRMATAPQPDAAVAELRT